MQSRIARRTLSSTAIAFLALTGAALPICATAAERIEVFALHFAPPDGTRVVETQHRSVIRAASGQPTHTDESDIRFTGTFKALATGYRYARQTDSYVFRRDGKEVSNPITETVMRAALTYTLDPKGKAIDIQGMAGLDAKANSALAPEAAARAAPVLAQLAEANLVAREKEEWDARYAEFADRTFTIGGVSDDRASYSLPSGEQIEYWMRTTVPNHETCPAGNCVRIDFSYESDAAEVAKWANPPASSIGHAAAHPSAKDGSAPVGTDPAHPARITGHASRLIDPATMRIYAETFDRTITSTLTAPGQAPIEVSRHEQHTYDYRYE